jgi:hypothetical protein
VAEWSEFGLAAWRTARLVRCGVVHRGRFDHDGNAGGCGSNPSPRRLPGDPPADRVRPAPARGLAGRLVLVGSRLVLASPDAARMLQMPVHDRRGLVSVAVDYGVE